MPVTMLSRRASSTPMPSSRIRPSSKLHPLTTTPLQTSPISFLSSTPSNPSYASTVPNLKIGSHTRVIFQGFTGRQATANARESLAWGTNIVGGVKPGSHGEHLGLPVLPSVKEAMKQLKPDATGIYVAAHQAAAAIEEAVEAEVPLIVAVAEHIPLHDVMRIHSMLSTQSKSRLVGANAPGIISAIGKCRIGFQPLPTFSPGHVGIVAKSGTLSYETVASVTRAGLGQSLCIGMGGDVIAGTNFVDALKVFENDPDTEGIILVGEVGGRAEEEAADWIRDYKKRTSNPKPIAALIGGKCAKPGYVMGHAGAWQASGENNADQKYKILQDAGAVMVDHPSRFGNVMKGLLTDSGRNVQKIQNSAASQKRGYHTSRKPMLRPEILSSSPRGKAPQRRDLHLNISQSSDILSGHGITVSGTPSSPTDTHLVAITVDRSARSPCILASPTADPESMHRRARRIPFDYRQGLTNTIINEALQHLQMDAAPPAAKAAAANLISVLHTIFREHEGITIQASLSIPSDSDTLLIHDPRFTFDDAAFNSCGRNQELHALRDTSTADPAELSAEKDGIVYVKLGSPDDPTRNIGTLVNGAGLAMNTVDALALPPHNGLAANFLDTGGKATAETVKRSFELVLSDPRVKVVFVNIFGGLTLCDMIANGILLAFKQLGLEERGVPVVVRLRGTNEQEGQRIVAESGLKVFAYDGFDEAAAKVVELARAG